MKTKHFDKLFYAGILLLSVLFLFFGNRIASRGMFVSEHEPMPIYSAVVTETLERIEMFEDFPGWGSITVDVIITFYAELDSGEIVRGEQSLAVGREKEVEVGDNVLLTYNHFLDMYFFMDYVRINYILILGIIFFVLVVAFGKMKGFNSIVSLAFIAAAIFMVFVPAILSGMNIYITAAIICIYAIVSTLLIVIGPNKKAVSAMLGCLGGVLLAGALMFAMDIIMHLTGMIDHETINLLNIPTDEPINIRAIIFAGVIIGSTGAIMDVAMSISSSLWEVRLASRRPTFTALYKSGMEIGKDTLGTMLNTLILAYIGSSLSWIVLITASTSTLTELFNTELIIVELLRALVGSFGMFLTIPLTTAICSWLYLRNPNEELE